MFEYQTLFDARGALYHRANRAFPEARADEARRLLDHLQPGSEDWLDVSAGGGYLSERAGAEGLPPARFACDGSLHFLRVSGAAGAACVSRAEELPFGDGSCGGAACLAALHHSEEPAAVACELLRVTRPGGRVALGDVAAGSPAAAFLNGFVDRHTEAGHHGRFYDDEVLGAFLAEAGGARLRAEIAEITWDLPGLAEALLFCRNLFGLVPETGDEELSAALGRLGAAGGRGRFRIPWTMVYASAERT